jgi:hypothetical protein
MDVDLNFIEPSKPAAFNVAFDAPTFSDVLMHLVKISLSVFFA